MLRHNVEEFINEHIKRGFEIVYTPEILGRAVPPPPGICRTTRTRCSSASVDERDADGNVTKAGQEYFPRDHELPCRILSVARAFLPRSALKLFEMGHDYRYKVWCGCRTTCADSSGRFAHLLHHGSEPRTWSREAAGLLRRCTVRFPGSPISIWSCPTRDEESGQVHRFG